MRQRPRCCPTRYSRGHPGIILFDRVVTVMRNLDTGAPDLRLAGFFAYLHRKGTTPQGAAQRLVWTHAHIETDLGLSPYLIRKFTTWLEVAGLLRYRLEREPSGVKLIGCYTVFPHVLDPLVDGLVPWPTLEVVRAYGAALATYGRYTAQDARKPAVQALLHLRHLAIDDYVMARMYAPSRPAHYVRTRARAGYAFAKEPTASPLRPAPGVTPAVAWPVPVLDSHREGTTSTDAPQP